MSFSYKDQFLQMNNRWTYRTLDFAIDVAEKIARDDEERAWAVALKKKVEYEFFPGRDLDVEEDFPSVDERKFWARVCFKAMPAIYNREIGNNDNTSWQHTQIAVFYILARWLIQSMREVESQWEAEPAYSLEEEFYFGMNMKS